MPEEPITNQTQGDVPQQAPAPVAEGAPPAGPAGDAAPAGAAPGVAPGAGVREMLGRYGIDGSAFQSDEQALQTLLSVANEGRQAQSMLPYAQQYLQHAGEFQQYLAERQRQAAWAQAQQQQSWWKAPEFDPTWRTRIFRDQEGALRVAPGQDPAILAKYQAWQDHQTDFLNSFSRDPIAAIRPGIEQLIEQRAGEIIARQMAYQQEQQVARAFIANNSSWLHQTDAQGNLVTDPRTGRPALSGLGRQLADYVREAEMMGLSSSDAQQRYAMTALQRDVAVARLTAAAQGGGAAPVDQAQAMRNDFLSRAGAQYRGGPAAQGQAPAVPVAAAPGARGLAELMRQAFVREGFAPNQELVG